MTTLYSPAWSVRALIVTTLVVASAVGCTSDTGVSSPSTNVDKPSPSASTIPPVSPPAEVNEICVVDMPESWRERMPSPEPLSTPQERSIELITEDGGTVEFVAGSSPRIEWTPAGAGKSTVVQVLEGEPEAQILSIDFDGRYLAYSITWSYWLFESPWTIYLWDTLEGGGPVKLADSPTENYPDGTAGSAPMISVIVIDGTVAWVAHDPTDDDPYSRSVFTYDAAADATSVLARGGYGPVYRIENTLLTSATDQESSDVRWHTFALTDEPPVILPSLFTDSREISTIASSRDWLVWQEGESRLWLWHRGDLEPALLIDGRTPAGEPLTGMDAYSINERFLTLRVQDERAIPYPVVLDLKSMSWTTIPDDLPDGEFDTFPGLLKAWYYSDNDGTGGSAPVFTPNDDLPPLPTCAT